MAGEFDDLFDLVPAKEVSLPEDAVALETYENEGNPNFQKIASDLSSYLAKPGLVTIENWAQPRLVQTEPREVKSLLLPDGIVIVPGVPLNPSLQSLYTITIPFYVMERWGAEVDAYIHETVFPAWYGRRTTSYVHLTDTYEWLPLFYPNPFNATSEEIVNALYGGEER